MAWRLFLHPIWHTTNFIIYFTQKKNKSLRLTIALYYLPIVLNNNMTTKHNFYVYVWSPDWKTLQHFVCRTGHSSTESPQ